MDENRTWQKLAAEFLGTAFLVFVGVGSVPALAMARGTMETAVFGPGAAQQNEERILRLMFSRR